MKEGWVYVLGSDTHPFHKIGITTTSPAQRVKEINRDSTYGPFGPWYEIDVRKVRNVTEVETSLHRQLQERRSLRIPRAREVFEITKDEARAALSTIPESDLADSVPIQRLMVEPDLIDYLMALFKNSGLENFRDIQESWTFSLFPKTAGGRFFTLNIDRHEVAFAKPVNDSELHYFSIVVDCSVGRDREFKQKLKPLAGAIYRTPYLSNWGNAVSVNFEASFDEASRLFEVTAFRRALVAYWYDALLRMRDLGNRSLHAKHHNYGAVSEIFRHMEQRRRFRLPN
jgi:hypothetical protein